MLMTNIWEVKEALPFSCDNTCRLLQFSVSVQVLGVEDSHSRAGSRAAPAKEGAKDLVESAAAGLGHEAVLVHMDNGILAVDG